MHLDPFMKHLGFEGHVTAAGEARMTVRLKHEHLNRRYVIKNLTGTWGPERLPGRGLL